MAGQGPKIRAFTLIELVLVVATVAVLSAIAVPRHANSMNGYRAGLAAKRLVADLTLARAAARSSGTGLLVDFSTPTHGYTFVGHPAPNGQAGDYTVKLSDEPYKVRITSVAFGSTTPAATAVRFNRFGNAEVEGTVVVTCGDHSRTILVDAVTGRSEVR